MEIETLRQRKLDLEDAVHRLVAEFELATGVCVASLDLVTDRKEVQGRVLHRVHAGIDIGKGKRT